jgi:protease PrsW
MVPTVFFVAMLAGVLPALLWLAFWLLEDRCEPEPKRYLLLCFFAGALMVPVALYLEQMVMQGMIPGGESPGSGRLLMLATIEEVLKFGAAYFAALRLRVFDEPLDAVIYMITAALGFAAFENALFLLTPLAQGDIVHAITLGDYRFIGAMLLHTLASATIGLALAMAFYLPPAMRRLYAFAGVILAIFLHTLFNFFILEQGRMPNMTFWVFLCTWFGIVAVLYLTEQIKQPARDYC